MAIVHYERLTGTLSNGGPNVQTFALSQTVNPSNTLFLYSTNDGASNSAQNTFGIELDNSGTQLNVYRNSTGTTVNLNIEVIEATELFVQHLSIFQNFNTINTTITNVDLNYSFPIFGGAPGPGDDSSQFRHITLELTASNNLQSVASANDNRTAYAQVVEMSATEISSVQTDTVTHSTNQTIVNFSTIDVDKSLAIVSSRTSTSQLDSTDNPVFEFVNTTTGQLSTKANPVDNTTHVIYIVEFANATVEHFKRDSTGGTSFSFSPTVVPTYPAEITMGLSMVWSSNADNSVDSASRSRYLVTWDNGNSEWDLNRTNGPAQSTLATWAFWDWDEVFTGGVTYEVSVSEELGLDDLVSLTVDIDITITEEIGLNDPITPQLNIAGPVTEEIGLAAFIDGVVNTDLVVTEGLALDDTTQAQIDFNPVVDEGFRLDDTPVSDLEINKTVNEGLGLNDNLVGGANFLNSVSEELGLDDTVAAQMGLVGDVSDELGLDDTVAAQVDLVGDVNEELGLDDSYITLLEMHVTVDDNLGLNDTIVGGAEFFEDVIEVIGLDDKNIQNVGIHVAVSESIALDENIATEQLLVAVISEDLGLDDINVDTSNYEHAILEGLGLDDSYLDREVIDITPGPNDRGIVLRGIRRTVKIGGDNRIIKLNVITRLIKIEG